MSCWGGLIGFVMGGVENRTDRVMAGVDDIIIGVPAVAVVG